MRTTGIVSSVCFLSELEIACSIKLFLRKQQQEQKKSTKTITVYVFNACLSSKSYLRDLLTPPGFDTKDGTENYDNDRNQN